MSASAPQLPLLIEDAMRSEESPEGAEEEGGPRVRVNQVCQVFRLLSLSVLQVF